MNNAKAALCLLMLIPIWITACRFKPFQPPPDMYKYWGKSGASTLEVKKAMLECGFPGIYEWPSWSTSDKNKIALMYRCMEISGFSYSGDGDSLCDGWRENTKPLTCDKNASVPPRSVKERINSEFCHRYPEADVCDR